MSVLKIKNGNEWESVTAIRGEQGPQGEQGPAGADGSDYVLTAADKSEIAALAGLLITITMTQGVLETYTADKTAQEIYDALEAGIMPVIKSGSYYYPISYVSTDGSSSLELRYSGLSVSLSASSMSDYPTVHIGGSN